MRREDRFLFLATRQTLEPQHIERMEHLARERSFHWERVFSAAEQNGVAPLIYRNICAVASLIKLLPENICQQARLSTIRNALYKKERAEQLHEAIQFFNELSIPVLIIKGAAQELLVYDEPWYTVSHDIDLILRPQRASLPIRLVENIGHKFHRKRVEFDYYEHHDMSMNGVLAVDFESVWQDARPINCFGEPALVLSPEDHLLSICINSCRKRYFRLKSLFDIHETILKCPDIDWDRLASRARKFECANIVYTALLVSSLTLETPAPRQIMQKLQVTPVRAAMIQAGVRFLLRFWSLTVKYNRPRYHNRAIDPTLLLTYLSYRPDQILNKFRQIQEVHE